MSDAGGPSNLGILVVSSSVNTEKNCWLRISALRLLSDRERHHTYPGAVKGFEF